MVSIFFKFVVMTIFACSLLDWKKKKEHDTSKYVLPGAEWAPGITYYYLYGRKKKREKSRKKIRKESTMNTTLKRLQ